MAECCPLSACPQTQICQLSDISLLLTNNFTVVRQSHSLLQAIAACYRGFEEFLRRKAGDDRERANLTPWGHVRHAIGRLHSYSIAMLVLVEARKRWPELFEAFEVTHIPSAPRGGNPMQVKEDRCTGHDILRCVNAGNDVLNAYKALNAELGSRIDEKIKAQIKAPDDEFYTNVHAEVNLADNIYRDHQDPTSEGPVRFFNEGKFGRYIGCSKPTCLLCDLYFDEHPMGFQRRRSHRNLYIKWRAPEGTERHVLEDMAKRLRKTVFQTITERLGTRSKFDSRHTPTDPWRTVGSYRGPAKAMTDRGSTRGQIGHGSLDDVEEESFEAEESEEGVEELEDLMSQLDVGSSCGNEGDCRGSGDALGDEDFDDGGARL